MEIANTKFTTVFTSGEGGGNGKGKRCMARAASLISARFYFINRTVDRRVFELLALPLAVLK